MSKLIPKFLTSSGYFRLLNDPEFMEYMRQRTGSVPGTNVNSNQKQNSKLRNTKQPVSRGDVVVQARKEGRNLANEREAVHRYMATLPDAVSRVLNNTADILHGIGEGAIFSAGGPEFAAAKGTIAAVSKAIPSTYFATNALNDIIHGRASFGTGLDLGFAAMPYANLLYGLGSKAVSATKNAVLSASRKGAQIMASPYTGKWTPVFGREVRFKPGIASINFPQFETRPINIEELGELTRPVLPQSYLGQEAWLPFRRTIEDVRNTGYDPLSHQNEFTEFLSHNRLGTGITNFNGREIPIITGSRGDLYTALQAYNATGKGTNGYLTVMSPDGYINHQGRVYYRPTTQREILPSPPEEININIPSSEPVVNTPVIDRTLRTRSREDVQRLGPYTYSDLFYPTGARKFDPHSFLSVLTGAHGDFINSWGDSDPSDVFEKLFRLKFDRSRTLGHLSSIASANPRGRSGLIVETHLGDLSVDSNPLANAFQRRLGKVAYPLENRGYVQLNNFGYKNLFNDTRDWDMSPEVLEVFLKNLERTGTPLSAGMTVEREANGSLIIKDTDGRSLARVPAREAEEVLSTIDAGTKAVNSHFGLNYGNATLGDGSGSLLWTFRRPILVPNQYHIITEKKGGNIKLNKKKR